MDSLLAWLKKTNNRAKREKFLQLELDGTYWERCSVSDDTDLLVHKLDKGNNVYILDCHYEKKKKKKKRRKILNVPCGTY